MKTAGFLLVLTAVTTFGAGAVAASSLAQRNAEMLGHPDEVRTRLAELLPTDAQAPDATAVERAKNAAKVRAEKMAKLEAAEKQRAVEEDPASAVQMRGQDAPSGYTWLTADPYDFRLTSADPAGLTDAEWQERAKASAGRVRDRFPFLATKADPRRQVFETWIAQNAKNPTYAPLFALSSWPELAAAECAKLHGW